MCTWTPCWEKWRLSYSSSVLERTKYLTEVQDMGWICSQAYREMIEIFAALLLSAMIRQSSGFHPVSWYHTLACILSPQYKQKQCRHTRFGHVHWTYSEAKWRYTNDLGLCCKTDGVTSNTQFFLQSTVYCTVYPDITEKVTIVFLTYDIHLITL